MRQDFLGIIGIKSVRIRVKISKVLGLVVRVNGFGLGITIFGFKRLE